jgi:hypothetical protein
MPDMLGMSAGKIGDPVLVVVRMEGNDGLEHGDFSANS